LKRKVPIKDTASTAVDINPYFLKIAKSGYKPSNEGLWDKAVAWAKRTYKKWPSAYASLGAAKKYKELGGKWKRTKTADLRRWLAEKWVREDGKPCGRQDADARVSKEKYPYCRPAKKVTEDTPVTWKELSESQADAKKREKAKVQKSSRGKKPSKVTPIKRKRLTKK